MNDVVVSNPTDQQIGIHWHNTPYFVPPNQAISIPKIVADDCLGHEDYADIQLHEVPEGTSAENYAKEVTIKLQGGETVESIPAPTRDVTPPDTAPDWDPMTCAYEEVEAYIEKSKLIIDPDNSEQEVRQLVDEHSQTTE